MLGRGLVEFWPLDVWMRNASWNRESSFSYVANTFPVSPTRETPSSSEIWSGEAPTMTKTMTGKEVIRDLSVYCTIHLHLEVTQPWGSLAGSSGGGG